MGLKSKKEKKPKEKKKKTKKAKSDKKRINFLENTRLGRFVMGCYNNSKEAIGSCNKLILFTVIGITIFGVLMVFSASYYQTVYMADPDPLYYMKKQLFNALTGFVMLFFFAGYDYHKYDKWGNIAIIISLLSLALVLVFGVEVNGAKRWFNLGFTSLTPSEFSKLFVILFTGTYLNRNPEKMKKLSTQVFLVLILLAHVLLIMKQPNLSTAIVIALIMGSILLVGGLYMGWIVAGLAGGVALVGAILVFFRDIHWYSRITSFLDPFSDAQGTGYQVTQGLIALGNGGLFGLGAGKSVAKNLYLPEPHNDFILAIIGEEFGFIGFIVLMAVYVGLFYLCIITAVRATDRLGFYLATGVGVMVGLQVVINVAVVTSSMPPTGITLPFVSYGGTSIWVFMIAIGIVLNISRGQFKEKKNNRKVAKQK